MVTNPKNSLSAMLLLRLNLIHLPRQMAETELLQRKARKDETTLEAKAPSLEAILSMAIWLFEAASSL